MTTEDVLLSFKRCGRSGSLACLGEMRGWISGSMVVWEEDGNRSCNEVGTSEARSEPGTVWSRGRDQARYVTSTSGAFSQQGLCLQLFSLQPSILSSLPPYGSSHSNFLTSITQYDAYFHQLPSWHRFTPLSTKSSLGCFVPRSANTPSVFTTEACNSMH